MFQLVIQLALLAGPWAVARASEHLNSRPNGSRRDTKRASLFLLRTGVQLKKKEPVGAFPLGSVATNVLGSVELECCFGGKLTAIITGKRGTQYVMAMYVPKNKRMNMVDGFATLLDSYCKKMQPVGTGQWTDGQTDC